MKPSRTPQGVRGLKLYGFIFPPQRLKSHSARSAWIETDAVVPESGTNWSHSARSAWIETLSGDIKRMQESVALRKECVD